jgi:hypothetical protein
MRSGAVHDLAAIVPEDVGDQGVHLDALRRARRGLRDALFVDRGAPDQDVEPDVILEANQVGLQQLRRLLPELGHGLGADLHEPVHVRRIDPGAVDLDDWHGAPSMGRRR